MTMFNKQMCQVLCASLAALACANAGAQISSLGATGWAATGTNNLGGTGTTGGDGAAAAKIYTVSTRSALIQALYGNTATIKSNGTFSGTLDNSKKIIYISGTISLNQNAAGTELTANDYVAYANAGSTTCAGYGYTSFTQIWNDYLAAYKPPYANVPPSSDPVEAARACASNQMKKTVVLNVPSNTSIIGNGATAKIIHGTLMLSGTSSSAPVDNIVVRNVAFEDAFDFFTAWDPTDSGGRWNSNYDTMSIQYATHVWIDHCTFSDGSRTDDQFPSVWAAPYDGELYHVQHHDGLLDITKSANLVTVSYNHLHDHDKAMLMGGTDSASLTAENPGVLKTTFHHNYFQNLVQRKPRVRYGMVHLYNNYFSGSNSVTLYNWMVGLTSGQGSKLYVENNVFNITGGATASDTIGASVSSGSALTNCAALSGMSTVRCSAYIFDSGNLLNGASVSLSSTAHSANSLVTVSSTPWSSAASPAATPSATPASYYSYAVEATGNLATSVPANAGVGKL
ncbi:polysaccharide lyase family 1 protein [Massilia sp. Root418]|uniref:pectate lyase family protein n=1 Tax=Massilia sp. Root418 TaxID=1736532 RepID=UPI000A7AA81B|nr:pectate lyase [Massilia sp. Root418]